MVHKRYTVSLGPPQPILLGLCEKGEQLWQNVVMTTNAEAVTWNALSKQSQENMRKQAGQICELLHKRTMIRNWSFPDEQTIKVGLLGGGERELHITKLMRKFEVLAVSLV